MHALLTIIAEDEQQRREESNRETKEPTDIAGGGSNTNIDSEDSENGTDGRTMAKDATKNAAAEPAEAPESAKAKGGVAPPSEVKKPSSKSRARTSSTSSSASRSEREAQAVAAATASADDAFVPSPALLNAKSPEALMSQVDGPNLQDYEEKDSVYVGRSVPISAGGNLTIPIHITTPGSVVHYSIEPIQYDVAVGITAEREEGVTLVKETSRHDASEGPVEGKFLVGTIPCLINFQLDNDYSWFREKSISYTITVTPPSKASIGAGRRRRAKACLKAVTDDRASALQRLKAATTQHDSLQKEIDTLTRKLSQLQKSLQVASTESQWLKERVALRDAQSDLLKERLEQGWQDEDDDADTEAAEKESAGKS